MSASTKSSMVLFEKQPILDQEYPWELLFLHYSYVCLYQLSNANVGTFCAKHRTSKLFCSDLLFSFYLKTFYKRTATWTSEPPVFTQFWGGVFITFLVVSSSSLVVIEMEVNWREFRSDANGLVGCSI